MDLFQNAAPVLPGTVGVLMQAVTSELHIAKEVALAALDALRPDQAPPAWSSFPANILFPAMVMTVSLLLARERAEAARVQAYCYSSEVACRSNSSIP